MLMVHDFSKLKGGSEPYVQIFFKTLTKVEPYRASKQFDSKKYLPCRFSFISP